MKGDTALKVEFMTMLNAIVTKAPVVHMDPHPPRLFLTDTKTKTENIMHHLTIKKTTMVYLTSLEC